MTAPTTASVDELVPQAIQLAERTGVVPSKRHLMQTFRIGREKATKVHERVQMESAKRRSRRSLKLAGAGRPQQPRREVSARVFDASAVPVSPGLGPVGPWVVSESTAASDAVRLAVDALRPPGPPAPVPSQRRRVRAWPLLLLALPAFVAIWSGWVGLGGLTGFGVVHPLPGIADDVSLNTAITLPIGLETYGTYALYVWLSGAVPARARKFAMWSAIASLSLGACGQVAYHLMVAADMTAAPWLITTAVACIPVAVLGAGAALYHLVHVDEKED